MSPKRKKIYGKPGASEAKNSKFVAFIFDVNTLEMPEIGEFILVQQGISAMTRFFTVYNSVEDGNVLCMGSNLNAAVKGKGKVDLEFSSGKDAY